MSFLALLKATICRVPSAAPPDTPSSAPPTTPFTEAPPCSSRPLHPPLPTTVPLVVTIKMNGTVLAERTTLPVPPAATWEAVARTRLEAVLDAAEDGPCRADQTYPGVTVEPCAVSQCFPEPQLGAVM